MNSIPPIQYHINVKKNVTHNAFFFNPLNIKSLNDPALVSFVESGVGTLVAVGGSMFLLGSLVLFRMQLGIAVGPVFTLGAWLSEGRVEG
jgi:hypothetical protein